MHCRQEVAAFTARVGDSSPHLPPPSVTRQVYHAFHQEAHPKQSVDVTGVFQSVTCTECRAMLALPGVGASREIALVPDARVVLRRDRRGALALEYHMSPQLTEAALNVLRDSTDAGIVPSPVVEVGQNDADVDVVEPCVVRLRVVDEEEDGPCTTNMVKDLVDLVVGTCLGMHLAVDEPADEVRFVERILELMARLQKNRNETFVTRKALLKAAHREVRETLRTTAIFQYRAVAPRWIQLEQAMKAYFHSAMLRTLLAQDKQDPFHLPWQMYQNRVIHGHRGFHTMARCDPDFKDIRDGSILRSRLLALSDELLELIDADRSTQPELWGTVAHTRKLVTAQLVLQELAAGCASLLRWQRDARRRYCGGHQDAEAFLRLVCFRAYSRQLKATVKDWLVIHTTLKVCQEKDPPACHKKKKKKKKKGKRVHTLPEEVPDAVEAAGLGGGDDDDDEPQAPTSTEHDDDDDDIDLRCPITMSIFKDPVLAADGNTYERAAIEAWLHKCQERGGVPTSPMTQEPLAFLHLPRNLAMYRLVQKKQG